MLGLTHIKPKEVFHNRFPLQFQTDPEKTADLGISDTAILNGKPHFFAVSNHGQNTLDTFTILSKIKCSIELLWLVFQFTTVIVKIFTLGRQLGISHIPEILPKFSNFPKC